MRYEGPVYRPPSEANSLLIQATVGCPHNTCTFCMVYKKGPRYRVRPAADIKEDLDAAREAYGTDVRCLFLPAGNTVAMPVEPLAEICRHTRTIFPRLERITVYGSSKYINEKGLEAMRTLREAGLSRIHVGLESGDDEVLRRIKKGATREEQITAGRIVCEAGIELSEYVMLGIGGKERSHEHATATASALNEIEPDFLRLRTFVPKINTPLLRHIERGEFHMLGPHEVLEETRLLLEQLDIDVPVFSDHYTNYINLEGRLPRDKGKMLAALDDALTCDEGSFRPYFVGTQ